MKAIIEVEMDNAAFEDYPITELARILESLVHGIKRGFVEHQTLFDINGNTVGSFKIEE